MCILCNHKFPCTFVTPRSGRRDCCGKHCGALSYCCPLTQLVCLGRDPRPGDMDDLYDADADKQMCHRCFCFGLVCLPFCVLTDTAITLKSCCMAESHECGDDQQRAVEEQRRVHVAEQVEAVAQIETANRAHKSHARSVPDLPSDVEMTRA